MTAKPSKRIRFPVAEPVIGSAEARAVARCVTDGWISSLSPEIPAFEREFAAFCGAREGVATSTGTAALHLALVALGVGPGDEVIVPDMTFVATANAVAYCGAKVVTADVDPRTWNLCPIEVARRVTKRTRAVIPVHLFGSPAAMGEIRAAAGGRVHVVEDAAESHGATLGRRRTGTLGTMGCFSFYANKTITTGEGGLITLDDARHAARLRFLRDHAMDPKKRYYHPELGFNYRLTGLQAALGRAQMKRIDGLIERKRRNGAAYREVLAGIGGLEFQASLPGSASSEWMVSVLLPPEVDREDVAARLGAKGIDTRPFFHPISALPLYRGARHPVARSLHRRGLTLPSSARLSTRDVEVIGAALRRILARRVGR